jgi:uncharacterized protein DUF6429
VAKTAEGGMMEYDSDRIDDMVLALLCLTMHEEYGTVRAWKGHDWDVLDRLYQKGWIFDPKNKAKSVVFTEEGRVRAEQLFETHFRKPV